MTPAERIVAIRERWSDECADNRDVEDGIRDVRWLLARVERLEAAAATAHTYTRVVANALGPWQRALVDELAALDADKGEP